MTFPITPPPELLKHWEDDWFNERENVDVLLVQAFQAGADQELEACCEWLEEIGPSGVQLWGDDLRKDRRPQPPSLKEQALDQLTSVEDRYGLINTDYIRRALEQLDD